MEWNIANTHKTSVHRRGSNGAAYVYLDSNASPSILYLSAIRVQSSCPETHAHMCRASIVDGKQPVSQLLKTKSTTLFDYSCTTVVYLLHISHRAPVAVAPLSVAEAWDGKRLVPLFRRILVRRTGARRPRTPRYLQRARHMGLRRETSVPCTPTAHGYARRLHIVLQQSLGHPRRKR